ncbi:DUF427 domain-containing protein [Ruegeria profundi]|uniref:DUF427 domain-containing protein n=1 Tax=Ruegeria profundi TaxID=1685378 RepID=UPI001CD7E5A0|nr:DUF427 domain-containing protein [Ruegeria profundi]MCA0928092.1 DUF427 domain-containing protein [Ruegeria profundi]
MTSLEIENVQSYPRPPVLEAVPHTVRIEFGGDTIAETDRAFRVLETHHAPTYYLPPDDIKACLVPVSGRTFCEWKGVARYWDVESDKSTAPKSAWSYSEPTAAFAKIAGYYAFYAGLMDACFVGAHRVRPQAGDFYAGWVTDNLRGRIKGAPGTEFW